MLIYALILMSLFYPLSLGLQLISILLMTISLSNGPLVSDDTCGIFCKNLFFFLSQTGKMIPLSVQYFNKLLTFMLFCGAAWFTAVFQAF